MIRAAAAAIALLLAAGCAAPAADEAEGGAIVVSAPDDYSYLEEAGGAARPHLHDYWGGQDRYQVLDLRLQGPTQFANDLAPAHWTAATFEPPEGRVVPQGAANLTVALEVTPAPGDHYGSFYLAWRGPADDGFQGFDSDVPFGDAPIRVPLAPEDADLPHQLLSAWAFQVRVTGKDGFLRFQGEVHLVVEAERGLPIPLFPGHPDQWHGASQRELFAHQQPLAARPAAGVANDCLDVEGRSCGWAHRPDDGALVPYDASFVEVRLTGKGLPTDVVLTYHGADSRTFAKAEPTQSSGDERVYEIPVRGDGDGPYAQQSQWAFRVERANPGGDLVEYSLEATAFRAAPIAPFGSAA